MDGSIQPQTAVSEATIPSSILAPREYPSYVSRFTGTLRHRYDYRNPLHILAALVHVVTQTFGWEPLLRDVGRRLERSDTRRVPGFDGSLPRLRENTTGLVRDVRERRILSAALKAWNYIGDFAADGVDVLADVQHGRGATRAELAGLLRSGGGAIARIGLALETVRGAVAQVCRKKLAIFVQFMRVRVHAEDRFAAEMSDKR